MGYSDCEALWLTRLRAMSEFDNSNTSRGNFKVLNNGVSNRYAVLFKGEPDTRERIGFRLNVVRRLTTMRIYQRYKDDGTSQIALQDLIDDITAALNPYRVMGDASGVVQSAMIIEQREMMQMPVDAPQWLYVELIGACDEEESITFAE